MNYTKVGIVTFHNAHNYGAVLQAYALHRKLELLGIKSEFIQDISDTVGNKYRLYPSYSSGNSVKYIKQWVKLVLDFKRNQKRHKVFQKFISDRLPVCNLDNGRSIFDNVIRDRL